MRNQGCALRLVGALFSLVLSLIVLGGVGYVFLNSGGGSIDTFFSSLASVAVSGTRTIIRPVIPVTEGGDGRSPDLLILNYQLSGSAIAEALATPNAAALNRGIPIILSMTQEQDGRRVTRWERQVGTDEGGQQINYTFDETAVYVTINDELLALDLQTGQQKWGVSTSDAIDSLCTSCMAVSDDKVILLTADSTLQAFNTRNGQSLWAIRLTDANRAFSNSKIAQFAVVNGQVLILDDVKTDSSNLVRGVLMYDAGTGKLLNQLSPVCGESANPALSEASEAIAEALETNSDIPQEMTNAFSEMANALSEAGASIPLLNGGMDAQSTVILDANQDAIYFILGGFAAPLCLQRWQISTGQLAWSTNLPEGLSRNVYAFGGMYVSGESPLWMSGKANFYVSLSATSSEPAVIVTIDQLTGKQRFVLEQADYGLMPLVEVDGTLFARSTKMRGTTRDEIWGIDTASGDILWQQPLEADHLLGVDIGIGTNWDYHLTSAGLAVLQLRSDPDRVIAQVFTADGQVTNEATTNVGDDFWQSTAWTDDGAYLAIRDLFAVDLSSGQTQREWP